MSQSIGEGQRDWWNTENNNAFFGGGEGELVKMETNMTALLKVTIPLEYLTILLPVNLCMWV